MVEYVADRPDAPIFSASDGSMVRLSNWRHRIWFPAVEQAGLPSGATPYVLRHTAANLMAQQGVPVSTAAAALGHDPAIYLRTYAHLYPGDLRSAADAMDAVRMAAREEKTAPADIMRSRRPKSSADSGSRIPTADTTDSRAGIARGRKLREPVPRRPPAPDLRFFGGGKGIRTPDLLTASQALYQLSYTPEGRFRLAVPGEASEMDPALATASDSGRQQGAPIIG
jgi:hypothetical protein